jgi:thiol-disulfide isomerase/thioredoxin
MTSTATTGGRQSLASLYYAVSEGQSRALRARLGSGGFRSRRTQFVAALAAAAALLGAITYRLGVQGRGDAIHEALSDGRTARAPAFDLEVLTAGDLGSAPKRWWRVARDGRVTLPELRGNPVVLNFWSPECTPCRQEAPVLQRVADEAGRGVLVLGIGHAGSREQATDFVHAHGLSFPQVHDSSGATARRWEVEGVPETFFLNADGDIVAHVDGLASARQLCGGVAAAVSGGPAGLQRGGRRDALER